MSPAELESAAICLQSSRSSNCNYGDSLLWAGCLAHPTAHVVRTTYPSTGCLSTAPVLLVYTADTGGLAQLGKEFSNPFLLRHTTQRHPHPFRKGLTRHSISIPPNAGGKLPDRFELSLLASRASGLDHYPTGVHGIGMDRTCDPCSQGTEANHYPTIPNVRREGVEPSSSTRRDEMLPLHEDAER